MAGATVIVLPVPQSPKAGQSLTPVSRATTDSNGDYTLRLSSSERSQLMASGNNDYRNLHIIAFYPDAMANWFMPLSASTQAASTADPSASTQAVPTAHLVLQQLPSQDAANAAASDGAVPQTVIPPGATSCSVASNTEIPGVEMVVGYKSTLTASHIKFAQFTYTRTVSQSTGVGLSLTGANAGFSTDGTTSQSSGIQVNFKQITGASNNDMAVVSTWNDTKWSCFGINSSGVLTPFTGWTVTLNGIGGPWSNPTPGTTAVAVGKCETEGPATPFTMTTTAQATDTHGVSISDMIGINLSSQDGWSTSAALTYSLATSAPVCGVSNFPGATNPSAGFIQVH